MSDSNLCVLASQRETAWGTAAVPCALKKLRFTGETFEHEKTTVMSQEIRDDRQTDESIEVGVMVKGGFEFELSVGDFDEWIESALMGTWSGGGLLINGVTETSFVVEKKFTAASFVSLSGVEVDTFSLNFSSKAIVTGSFGCIGLAGVSAAATVDSAAGYTAAGAGLILSSSASVGSITVGGVAQTAIKSFTVDLNNNLRGNDVIGKKTIDDVGVGECGIKGKIDAYFRTRTLMETFINHTYAALVITVSREATGAVSGDHIGYSITLPHVEFDKGFPRIPGKNTDLMVPLEYTAHRDPTTGYMIAIQRLFKP